jgi:hypothetical protein
MADLKERRSQPRSETDADESGKQKRTTETEELRRVSRQAEKGNWGQDDDSII